MRYIYTFLIMFGFWILLSGKLDLFHLTLGILVSFLFTGLFMYDQGKNRLSAGFLFLRYIPWLLCQVVLSTLHLTFLALHPKIKYLINSTIFTFKTKLKTEIGKGALANSIFAYVDGNRIFE